ncbi:hypothetical protein ACRRTK_001642 [Alexandromys fortis]
MQTLQPTSRQAIILPALLLILSIGSDSSPGMKERGQKRDSQGSRLPPRTKGPCGPPPHPTPAVASHSPRTPFHTLTASSQVDIKLFIVVCLEF